MMLVNNESEKSFRDAQTKFGHLGKGKGVLEWLHDEYHPGSIRERRYRKIAEDALGKARCMKVLEIAAGIGDFVTYCQKLFPSHEYFANELSRSQLENNITKVQKFFRIDGEIALSFTPVEHLEYAENTFDLIFIKAAVHHFEDPKKGFAEIWRVLRPGGRVVFFEDPIVLNIPLYKSFKKATFAPAERRLGINEHIYSVQEYLAFGEIFRKKSMSIDSVLIGEYDTHQKLRHGFKKVLGAFLRKGKKFFTTFMLWRFSGAIFIFEK